MRFERPAALLGWILLTCVIVVVGWASQAADMSGPGLRLRGGAVGAGGSTGLQDQGAPGGVSTGAGTVSADPVGTASGASSGRVLEAGAWPVYATAASGPADADMDGAADAVDNCTQVPNGPTIPDEGGGVQLDIDGDGFGNACDCDFDNDGSCTITDFNVFLPAFQATLDPGNGTDMDGDGAVGIGDFNLFLPGFRAGAPGPSGLVP